MITRKKVCSKLRQMNTRAGWVQKEEVFTIIGECDHTFVYQLQPSAGNDLSSEKIKYILPIGIHKSRLVQWISGQLTMFDQDQFIWSNRGVTPARAFESK